MTTTYRLRWGVEKDIATIAACQVAMALETEDMELAPATVEAGVRAVIEDSGKGRYLVAEGDDGSFAGVLLTVPEWSDWRCGTVLWIHSVYVMPAFRRSGVYRAMYRYLQDMVQRAEGYRGLRLYVDKGNEAAQRVYQALGMNDEHYALFEWMA